MPFILCIQHAITDSILVVCFSAAEYRARMRMGRREPFMDLKQFIERAEAAIGDTDPHDLLYLACAIANDAAVWSELSDFDEQDVVETYATNDVIKSFDTL